MSYKNKTDNELVEFANHGNSDALSTLIERHYMTIYKFSYKICGNQNDAEEVAQESSIKVATKLDLFKGDSLFTTWLYRIVINTAKDFYRAKKSKHETQLFEDINVKSNDNQEKQIIAKQTLNIVNELPIKIRDAVILVHWEGLNHKEAADILECKESTISWRISEARKEIKQRLEEAN